jgi:hypothetical protein
MRRELTLSLLVLSAVDHGHGPSGCHGTPLAPLGSHVLPQTFYDDDLRSERSEGTAAQLFKTFTTTGDSDDDADVDASLYPASRRSRCCGPRRRSSAERARGFGVYVANVPRDVETVNLNFHFSAAPVAPRTAPVAPRTAPCMPVHQPAVKIDVHFSEHAPCSEARAPCTSMRPHPCWEAHARAPPCTAMIPPKPPPPCEERWTWKCESLPPPFCCDGSCCCVFVSYRDSNPYTH